MDATIMALGPIESAPTPLSELDLIQYPQEIALAWVHLPSGGAAVQGIVRHPDGGPIVAGSAVRSRPVGAGGTEVLLPGADPHGGSGRGPLESQDWAMTTPDTVEPMLAERGWRLTTRADAVDTLTRQGYRMRDSTAPGHILHLDQGDDSTWHDWTVGGKPFPYLRVAFVTRRMPSFAVSADLAGTGADAETGASGDAKDREHDESAA